MNDKQKENIENNNNMEEEEIEENENINQIQEEYYDSTANQEDGQEFEVAFDIQINDGSFILLVGKTEENKLILRLVDKEDETKPFFQNEFSLDELKEISSFFNHFNNENEAIDCVIKNLNENEKEIQVIDNDCIKLTLIMNGNRKNGNIDFILHKITFIMEGNEEEQQNSEINGQNGNGNKVAVKEKGMNNSENEEGIEEFENDNGENDNEEHIEDENLEYSEDIEKSDKKRNSVKQNENKNIQNQQENQSDVNSNSNTSLKIINNAEKESGLQTIMEDINENAKVSSPVKQPSLAKRSRITVLNEDSGEKEEEDTESKEVEENDKISKVIEELKENLDSLGGAMNFLEQNGTENQNENANNGNNENISYNANENISKVKNEIMKIINSMNDNFNSQLKKQNDYFLKAQKEIKEANENKIKDIKNELKKKNNELNNVKKLLEERISSLENNLKNEINKTNDELKNIKNGNNNNNIRNNERVNSRKDITQQNNITNANIEKIKNDFNSKINEINQKISNLKNDFNNNSNNNRGNDSLNVNAKTFLDKINNLENKLKQNDDNIKNNNNSINDKLKIFETKIKNIDNKSADNDKKILFEKINNLENKSKSMDNFINNFKKNNKVSTPSNDKGLYDKIYNLEKLINDIKDKKNKNDFEMKKNIDETANNDLITKVNNLINWSKTFENDFQNMETEMKNNDNYLDNVEKRIVKLENKLAHINMLKKPVDGKIDKESNEIFQKVITNNITNEEDDNDNYNLNTNKSAAIKKIKKTKINQYQKSNSNDNNENDKKIENNTKNYRMIKVIDDNQVRTKKYASQTYTRGNNTSSHSMNKLNLKQNNNLDRSEDYDPETRPRSRSKEHKRRQQNYRQENDNYSEIHPPKKRAYKSKNSYNNKIENINQSNIIQYDDIIFLENRIKKIYPKLNINFNLVYRATEDGDRAIDFHNKCDKIGPNITLVRTKSGYVFGGFTVKNWEHLKRDINKNKPNLGSASRDAKAFGFCVNYQKIYNNERPDEFAIWCNRNFGPTFKNNFFQIFDNFFKRGGYCSVKNNSHFGGQDHDYEISGGEPKFGVEELEVFEILFQ